MSLRENPKKKIDIYLVYNLYNRYIGDVGSNFKENRRRNYTKTLLCYIYKI